jgi:hypothetical protein
MTNHSTALVQKLWNYCNILRDDGLSYGDYVEQLTFLLFGSLAPARSGVARSLRERRLAATPRRSAAQDGRGADSPSPNDRLRRGSASRAGLDPAGAF